MPRSANGTYTLPSGNPVVGGTYITASWANPTMEDLAAAMTDSLSRTGQGGMQVPFKNADGNTTSPGISWVNETNTGFYRAASQDMRVAIGGYDKFRWTASGAQVWNGAVWSDVVTNAGLTTALANYGDLTENESVTGAWNFVNGLTTTTVNGATTLGFTIGGTSKGVLSATEINFSVPVQVGGVAAVLASRQVATTNSLTGGGALSADHTLQLVNDSASPGTSFYYGTNSGGVKGYHSLSSVVGVPEAPIDGTSYARNNASWVSLGSGGAQYVLKTGDTMTGQLQFILSTVIPLYTFINNATGTILQMQNNAGASGNRISELYRSATEVGIRENDGTLRNLWKSILSAGSPTAFVYGDSAVLAATHDFYGPVNINQALAAKAGLAVTGAATISTTLGVTGALTVGGSGTFSQFVNTSGGFGARAGSSYAAWNAGNTIYAGIALGAQNELAYLANGSLEGAMWHWLDQALPRGNVSITTTAPSGTDVTKAGNIVLVY